MKGLQTIFHIDIGNDFDSMTIRVFDYDEVSGIRWLRRTRNIKCLA